MTTRKKKTGPDGRPHTIDDTAWWYEGRGGIRVVAETMGGIAVVCVKWRSLLAAARRCGVLK